MDFIDLKAQQSLIQPELNHRIQAVLDHGKYIMGPEIQELEEALVEYTGAAHCISCSSGTDALLLALMSIGVEPGDEIITTPFTFIATAEMIALTGATPVFVDIDPVSYNIDSALVADAITERTRALVPVSLYGQCSNMTELNEIAARHNLPVIEDAAQSFGATQSGRKSCNLSTIGVTSFFPSKPLGCYGDGGALFTSDPEVAERAKQIRVHGQDRRYHHPLIGLNARMDTIQAAILLAKLTVFQKEVEDRSKIGARYTELLSGSFLCPEILDGNTSVYAQYTIQVPGRENLQQALKKKGIPSAVHYPIPLHFQPAFSYLNHGTGSFPQAEAAAANVISLPIHPYLTEQDQNLVVDTLLEELKGARVKS